MESNKNLVFLGMMGSGKTTLGKIVSKKLSMNFVDVDYEIEIKEGIKISDLFKEKGETFFRKLEEQTTLESLKKTNSIISLGGGAFINKKIQNEVLKNHISIWLKWNNKSLINRIKNNQKRPITIQLNNKDLDRLINKRSVSYAKARYKIECDRLSKMEITKKVIEINETN